MGQAHLQEPPSPPQGPSWPALWPAAASERPQTSPCHPCPLHKSPHMGHVFISDSLQCQCMKRCHSHNLTCDTEHETGKGACLTLEQVQVVGDLLQDHEAGQDEAHRALQALIRPLTPVRPVPLALLHTHSDSIIPMSSICLQADTWYSRMHLCIQACGLCDSPSDRLRSASGMHWHCTQEASGGQWICHTTSARKGNHLCIDASAAGQSQPHQHG